MHGAIPFLHVVVDRCLRQHKLPQTAPLVRFQQANVRPNVRYLRNPAPACKRIRPFRVILSFGLRPTTRPALNESHPSVQNMVVKQGGKFISTFPVIANTKNKRDQERLIPLKMGRWSHWRRRYNDRYPLDLRKSMTSEASVSMSLLSESSTSSALFGSSYGALMPVNSLISPARAFL